MGTIIFVYVLVAGVSFITKARGILLTISLIPLLPFMLIYFLFGGNQKQKQEALIILKATGLSVALFLFFTLVYLAFKY